MLVGPNSCEMEAPEDNSKELGSSKMSLSIVVPEVSSSSGRSSIDAGEYSVYSSTDNDEQDDQTLRDGVPQDGEIAGIEPERCPGKKKSWGGGLLTGVVAGLLYPCAFWFRAA